MRQPSSNDGSDTADGNGSSREDAAAAGGCSQKFSYTKGASRSECVCMCVVAHQCVPATSCWNNLPKAGGRIVCTAARVDCWLQWPDRNCAALSDTSGTSSCCTCLLLMLLAPLRLTVSLLLVWCGAHSHCVLVHCVCAVAQGELAVRGPMLFREYWGRQQATAEAFDEDGYFLTGDTVSFEGQPPYYRVSGNSCVVLCMLTSLPSVIFLC